VPGSASGDLAGLHLLVVEDDATALRVMSEVLREFGAQVDSAASAAAALAMLRTTAIDVVVADLALGDQTGTWLIREARRLTLKTPFIAVSGVAFEEERLRDVGFSAYLRKPLTVENLIDAVTKAARTS
jgi:two-component system, chemotaxis family, CheB/CheR fusion protein